MPNIKLLKEPGYIYDLMYIFCYKFNSKIYTENIPENEKKDVYVKKLNDTLASFGEVPNDLYVFFHAVESKRAFLPTYYFNHYQDKFTTSYNFDFLKKEILNHDKLIQNLIKFYFVALNDETVENCISSRDFLFSCIKKSQYSEKEKNRLYEFFMDPGPYIQLLEYELMQKEVRLAEYYKNNYQKIIDIYNLTTYDLLCEQLGDIRNLSFLNTQDKSLYASYCLLNNYLISFYYPEEGLVSLMGCDYISVIKKETSDEKEPNLYDLGTALGDESRAMIFKFILERGEIICKDLEKEFSFSGSTAYHHITIMTRSGLIKTRNEGKTILYSINKKYISDIVKFFNKII